MQLPGFFSQSIRLRTAILLLVGLLFLIAGGFILGTVLLRRSLPLSQPFGVAPSPVTQVPPEQSLLPSFTSLSNVIKPCLFAFYHSCAEQVVIGDATPPPKAAYENIIEADLFAAVSQQPGKQLVSGSIPLSDSQVRELFPEYVVDLQTRQVKVPAVLALHRISSKYNINPRVYIVLMEILNQGRGPLFNPNFDLSRPFFAENPGFISQLDTVSQELRTTQVKYELLQNDRRKLPTEMTFFSQKYSVSPGTNSDSLVLIEFLGHRLPNKTLFERALAPVAEPDKHTDIQTQNFQLLYQLLFGVNPS
jgi:hypothetical protein